jgi:hypothetical protein
MFCSFLRLQRPAVGLWLCLSVAPAATLVTPAAQAHEGAIGFGIRASYNNVPSLTLPAAFARGPVVYNLPDPATSTSIYAGAADSVFDVFAHVDHGTEMAAGFGAIMFVDGSGVSFEPLPIDLGHPDPPNNIQFSLNPDFPRNTSFDAMFADPDVPGFPAGHVSVGVAAIYTSPNQNTPVNDTDGLFAMPIRVRGGVVGGFDVRFDMDDEFTSFVNTVGTIFDNSPTRGGVIDVRASILGDLNGDGTADSGDVPGFLAAIADRSAFVAQYPWLQTDYVADFNEDRAINFNDVAGFEAACGCDTGLEPMPGDINGDMIVDRMDVAEFIALFGRGGAGEAAANGGGPTGDFDRDGHIGAGDLVILQMHLGEAMAAPNPTASAGPMAVPEPNSSLLALAAAILLLSLSRRFAVIQKSILH